MLKNRILRFFCFYCLFATRKPRHSVYTSTPSGIPKLLLWFGLCVPSQFYLSPNGRLFKNFVFKQPHFYTRYENGVIDLNSSNAVLAELSLANTPNTEEPLPLIREYAAP